MTATPASATTEAMSVRRSRRLPVDEPADRGGDEGNGRVDDHDVGDGRRHHRGGVGGDRDRREQGDERRERAETERVVEPPAPPFDEAHDRDRDRAQQPRASRPPSRRRDGRAARANSPAMLHSTVAVRTSITPRRRADFSPGTGKPPVRLGTASMIGVRAARAKPSGRLTPLRQSGYAPLESRRRCPRR